MRGCNITCRSCYNADTRWIKSTKQVREELDLLIRLRRLESVGIIGGEPTLHPQLLEIVRVLKSRGLWVELCTNGVALDNTYVQALKIAGIDLVVMHIEKGQKRPDLPSKPDVESVAELQERKAALIARHGIKVGLAVTIHPDSLDEMSSAIRVTLRSRDVDFLLLTLHRSDSAVGPLRGDFTSGFYGDPSPPAVANPLKNANMYKLLRDDFGLVPYAYLCSNVDKHEPRWLTYMAVTCANGDRTYTHGLRASLFEPLYGRISRVVYGRYPFGKFPKPAIIRAQLLFNGFFGGSLFMNLKFLSRSRRTGNVLKVKRIAFQHAATKTADGRLIHCRNCPDAVLKNGRLVPVCVTDFVDA